MAQATQTNILLDALLADITKLSSTRHARKLKQHKDSALRNFKSSQYVRVNQFEVNNTLLGLIEKFQVLDRDDLSTALDSKLHALKAHENKWTPEILALLLALSDRPVEKSPEYAPQTRPRTLSEPQLTWNDLLKDDPVSDEELWQDVFYSPISSDSENESLPSLERDRPRRSSRAGTISEEGSTSTGQFEQIDPSCLESVARFEQQSLHRKSGTKDESLLISELQAIREALFVVRGLPSVIFDQYSDGELHLKRGCRIDGLSAAISTDLMERLANVACKLSMVRIWMSAKHTESIWQSFTSSVQKQVCQLDQRFSVLETSLTSTGSTHVVSIIRLTEQIRVLSANILFLQSILGSLTPDRGPFGLLETLYSLICAEQASEHFARCQFLLELFLDSFRSFLQPIQKWMTEGFIASDVSFFIMELPGAVERSCVWTDQFHLKAVGDKGLAFPNFLQTSAQAILTSGKTVSFLKQLGANRRNTITSFAAASDFSYTLSSDWDMSLTPFPVLFATAFDTWIQSLHGSTASLLRGQMRSTYRLASALKGLQEIYMCSNGNRSHNMVELVLNAGRQQKASARNKYVLLDRIRSVFADSSNVDSALISMRYRAGGTDADQGRTEPVWLVDYNLPWPVMNVIQRRSLPLYQEVLYLLLRLHGARQSLRDMLLARSKTARNKQAIGLRSKMHWVVDILSSHFFHAVVHPACASIDSDMDRALDMDAMINVHERFISEVHRRCLLPANLHPIQRAMMSVLDLVDRLASCFRSDATKASKRIPRRRHDGKSSSWEYHNSRRLGLNSEHSESDSEKSHSEDAYEADTETLHIGRGAAIDRLSAMQEELDRSCSLMVIGLRGINRAGGDITWEMLADKLDWQ